MGRDHKRRSELLDAMERAVTWYHERLLSAPDAGPARDYLRSRGYDGDVVRQFRLGWAPDDWDALAKGAQAAREGAVGLRASASSTGAAGRRTSSAARVLFPICDPSGRPVALGGRILPARPGAAPPERPEPKYKNSQESPIYSKRRTLYALNWAEAGRHRPGRGRRVRGLHRRHRVLPGRRAVGGRHLRHRAGRGALHAVAQLRQAHRARLRRRRGRAERDVARLRVGAQARGRRRRGRPARRERPRRAGAHRPRRAGHARSSEARPFLQFRVDRMLGTAATSRRPRGGPGRPRPR